MPHKMQRGETDLQGIISPSVPLDMVHLQQKYRAMWTKSGSFWPENSESFFAISR